MLARATVKKEGCQMLHEFCAAVHVSLRRFRSTGPVVLVLGLGIGLNVVSFSVVYGVLFQPPPYPDGERLVNLSESNTEESIVEMPVAPVRIADWNRLNGTFAGIAGSYFENTTDTTGPIPRNVAAMRVSPGFFEVLGVSAALGRVPRLQEEVYGGPGAVVLSDSLWRGRFGSDPEVIGRPMMLNGEAKSIVGVMPATFDYPSPSTEAWIPAQLDRSWTSRRQARFMTTVGRLHEGVTLLQAQQNLEAIQEALGEEFPDTDRGWTPVVVPLADVRVDEETRRTIWIVFGATMLLLAAACGNVVCVLLADRERRRREMSLRSALGGRPGQIVRGLLWEASVLAIGGGLVGLGIGYIGVGVVDRMAVSLGMADGIGLNVQVVGFVGGIGVLTVLLMGLEPALHLGRLEGAGFRLAARGSVGGGHRLQSWAVAAQVAVAVVVIFGTGLLIRSVVRLHQLSPGFELENVVAFRMSASWGEDPAGVSNRQARTLSALARIPGVASAALSSTLPGGTDTPLTEFTVVGRESGEGSLSIFRETSAGYFRTLGIPLLHGRECADDVRPETRRELLVNRTFGDRFADGEPLGEYIAAARFGGERQIVGVVGDTFETGPGEQVHPIVYECGLTPYWPDPYFIVRTAASSSMSMRVLRTAMSEVEPNRAVHSDVRLGAVWASGTLGARVVALITSVFGLMALALVVVGLYGTCDRLVWERRREIALRIALGGKEWKVAAAVLRRPVSCVAVGVAIGLGGCVAAGRVLESVVFGIPAHDAATVIASVLVTAGCAVIAILVPGKRATRAQGRNILRAE